MSSATKKDIIRILKTINISIETISLIQDIIFSEIVCPSKKETPRKKIYSANERYLDDDDYYSKKKIKEFMEALTFEKQRHEHEKMEKLAYEKYKYEREKYDFIKYTYDQWAENDKKILEDNDLSTSGNWVCSNTWTMDRK